MNGGTNIPLAIVAFVIAIITLIVVTRDTNKK